MKTRKARADATARSSADRSNADAANARERQAIAMAAIFSLQRAIERGEPMPPGWGAWWLRVLSSWQQGLGRVSLEQAMGLKTQGRRGRGENSLLTSARQGVHSHYVVEVAGLRAMGFKLHEAIQAVTARFSEEPPWKHEAPTIKPLDYEAVRKLHSRDLATGVLSGLGQWARGMDDEVRAAYLAQYPRLALPPRFRPPRPGK